MRSTGRCVPVACNEYHFNCGASPFDLHHIPFPFVAFMVVDLGLVNSVNQAGTYAGYICGALMMGRFSSSLLWGIVADKWGRKPVMLISTISVCATSLLFGLAKSFEVAVLSRFLMGFGNAIVGTCKTLVPELVQKAFSLTRNGLGVRHVEHRYGARPHARRLAGTPRTAIPVAILWH